MSVAELVTRDGHLMTTVLQLLHSDEKGGVEMLAQLIGENLRAAGAGVETLFLYRGFSAGTGAKLLGMVCAVERIARTRPDMILAYQTTASVIAGVAGRAAGCQLRIVHQTAKPSTAHPISRWLDKLAGSHGFYTVNVANSHATLAEFDRYPAAYRANMRLIEHGVAPPEPRCGRAETLARYNIPSAGPILLNAGRLSQQKAQNLIIRALPHLPEAQLLLAGGGKLEQAYRDLARSLGVEQRVHYFGYLARQEVGDLMGAADVFVFPSEWETFGLAVVEAAMLGVPVVCADLPVLREVLSVEGTTAARFVDCADPGQLASAIQSELGHLEPAKARDLAAGLRRKYSQETMFAAYRALLWPEQRSIGGGMGNKAGPL